MIDRKVAVVTGSSRGIGYATSLILAWNGFHTYATMRNPEKSTEIKDTAVKEGLPLEVVQLDVNNDNSIKTAIDKIVSKNQSIDVLVNNAAYGLVGAFEDLSIEEFRSQFETNFFGIVRLTQQVIPLMRKQGSGLIINVSSLNGIIPFPIISAYSSTKFALEGLSESISYELEPFGIKVILIEPGVVATNFKGTVVLARKALEQGSHYSELLKNVSDNIDSLLENATQPEDVAKKILEAITGENPKLRYLVGDDAVSLMELRKKLDDEEFQKIVIQKLV
jgi:short-subunit dehydrogenase